MIYVFCDLGRFYSFATVYGFLRSWLFLGLGWMIYRVHDLRGFHSSAMMHRFLESWWFRNFLRCGLIFLETTILV